jgi:cytochrome c
VQHAARNRLAKQNRGLFELATVHARARALNVKPVKPGQKPDRTDRATQRINRVRTGLDWTFLKKHAIRAAHSHETRRFPCVNCHLKIENAF